MQAAQAVQTVIDPEQALAELRWLAASADPTRYTLARVWVDGKRAIATDGHRLHFINDTVLPDGFEINASDLEIVLGLVKSYPLLATDGSSWTFACGALVFQKNGARFTDVDRVIPRETDPVDYAAKDLRKTLAGTDTYPDYCTVGAGWFNARYVKEALNGAPKTVTVYGPTDEHSPVLFRYGNRGAVVMPMRKS